MKTIETIGIKGNAKMKKVVSALVLVLGVAFSRPPAASAVTITLSNTSLTDTEFQQFVTNATPILSKVGSPVPILAGTLVTVDSAVFGGTGVASGLYVYTYRVSVTVGNVGAIATPNFGAGSIVTGLDLGGGASPDSSFFISGGLNSGGPLSSFYGSNGTLVPFSSQWTLDNNTFRTTWLDLATSNGITGGSRSVIFGVLSALSPTLVTANVGGNTSPDPQVVAPIPEPGTLLLLGSGITGLAAWGWRKKVRRELA